MEYYIGLTIILLIITWLFWQLSIIISSNSGCPFHGVPSTEGLGEITIPREHDDYLSMQVGFEVVVLPSNIKWLRELCGRINTIIDVKEKNGTKMYRLSYIYMWVTEDQIEMFIN